MKNFRRLTLAMVGALLGLASFLGPIESTVAGAAGGAPDAPTGIVAVVGNGQATISWVAPAKTGSSAIVSYTVTSDTYLSKYPVKTCTTPNGATLTCIVTGLLNGVLYSFRVQATNASATSAFSAYSNTVTPSAPPGAPTAVKVKAGDAKAEVSWTAPTNTGGSALASYTATAYNANTTVASSCTTTAKTGKDAAPPATTCAINGLTNGLTYTVSVTATNAGATSPASTPAVSVAPVGAPPAPGAPTAVPGNTSATVTWTTPISTGGSPITGYTVTSAPDGLKCTTTTALSCTVTGLKNLKSYTFKVTAKNALGTSPSSPASNAVVPANVPGAPTSVTLAVGDRTLVATWVAPASNGGSAITKYVATAYSGATASASCTTAGALTCAITTLTNGTSYTIKVVASNLIGAGPASAASAAAIPVVPPGAPTNISGTGGNTTATITWLAPTSPSTAIVSYTVTSSPSAKTCTTPDGATLSCTVLGLVNGTSYTFTVVANFAGGKSPVSAPSGTIVPSTTPGAPTGVSATGSNGSLLVSWVAPVSNGGAAITGYTATASDLNGNVGGTCSTLGAVSCTITGLANGTSYTVVVRGSNKNGPGAASAASPAAKPSTLPSAPGTPTAVNANGAATVTWTAPVADGGSTITSYSVTAFAGATASYTCSTNGPLSCTVNGLTNGTAYTFKVVASNVNGAGPASSASAALTPSAPAGTPSVPLLVAATPATSQATVSWSTPTSNGGKAINGYTVTAFGPTGAVVGLCTTVGSLSCVVYGLQNGEGYTFSVFATNANGRGPASPSTALTTPLTLPSAPTNVSTAPGNGQVAASWNAPEFNGGSSILSYSVTAFDPNGYVAGTCSTANGATHTCTVTGLTNGVSYTFGVSATNSVGSGPLSISISIAATPSTVPSAPTSVTALGGNGAATVSWTPGFNGGAQIIRYTVTAFNALSTPSGSCTTLAVFSCIVTGLQNGTAYTFTVTATNANGTSDASSASSAITPVAPSGTPSVPTAVVASAGESQVVVNWSAPATDGGSSLTGYLATAYDPDSTVAGTCAVGGSTTTCVIGGLQNGTTYTVSVEAVNANGRGPASAMTDPVTPSGLPTAPTSVTAVPTPGAIAVSWSAPLSNGGTPVTSYTATIRDGNGNVVDSCTVDGVTTTCTVSGLTNGLTYTASVTATNNNGTSLPSAPTSGVTPSALPSAPQNVSASAKNGGAVVSWTAPASYGGSPITGYTVTSSPGGFICTTVGAFSCAVNGLQNGTSYTFTVTATNANGTSDPSSTSNVVTPSAIPSSPSNVTALASSGQAVVSWLPSASDSGSAITGYTVTSSPGGFICTTTGATTCVVSGLSNGTAYTFTVTATNGNGTSLASAPSDAVTPSSIPSAPQNVGAVPGNGQAVVSWNPPARDGGTPITGYAVTAFDPNGQVAGTCTTADGSALSCAVFNLTNGIAYTFSVAASNINGTGLSSAPSAAVTPSAIPTKPLTVTATSGNGQATVSWVAPSSTGGSPITGYTVTAFSGATPIGNCTTAGAFSCVVTGLTNGTAYTFKVYATNVNGDGPNSDPSSAVTPSTTPSAPTIVSATPGNGQIVVAWTAPGLSNGATITGYIATAYDQSQNPIATCTTSGALNCTINGLTNGLTYTVTVVATNVNGSGTASGQLTATPSTKPSAPVNVSGVAGNASVQVSWTVPATSGGSTILSYTVTAYVNSTPVTTCTTPDGSTLTCNVTGLTNGTAYTFKVTATNANGQSPASLASSPSTTPTGNPGAPTGVQATAGNGQLTATWTAPVSTGGSSITQFTATAYSGLTAIESCQTPDGVTTTCVITGLTNGTAYTVKVTATNVNGTGVASLASASATPSTKPNAPTNVSAVAGSGQATVSWSAPGFNGGSAITGYTVTSAPDFRTCTTQGATSCTVTGLTNGTSYTFTVIATNANGDSVASQASQQPATPAAASTAPQNVSASAGNGNALVSWRIPASNGGSRILSYTATSLPGSKTCTVQVQTLDSSTEFSCTVPGLTNGTAYTFTVKATNSTGQSAASSASNSVTPSTTPNPPLSVSAFAANNSATVSWLAPSTNGGSAILGYTVTANPGGARCTTNGALTCTVTGLTNGTSYTFSVIATNANGDSILSNPTSPIVPSSLPGPPVSPSAVSGKNEATVSWSAPFSNGGSAITSYTVTSTPDGRTCTTTDGTTLSCVVTGLSEGVSYTFTVSATNTEGAGPDSSSSSAVTIPTLPSAPRTVTGVSADKSVKVSWTAPVSNGYTPITLYTVTSTPGDFTCTTTGSLTCTVTGLTNGTSYTFVVVATNVLGDGAASVPSAAVKAGIAPPSAPQNILVFPGNRSVIVHWNPPASNGGSPITGYTVVVTNAAGKVVGTCTAPATATACVVPGLQNSTEYKVAVSASNAKFKGAVAPTKGTPMVAPPAVIDHFAPKSYKITKAMTLTIRKWAQLIKTERYHFVALVGHGSRELGSRADIALGIKRTQATLGVLKQELRKLHVTGVRFRIFSYGSNRLIVRTYRSTQGATSRRVTINYGN